mgnify:FL=1|jgi:transposase
MSKRYTEEFRREAVRQIREHGHPVAEVAERLGVSTHSLYQWIKRCSPDAGGQASHLASKNQEIGKLKAELRRVTEERDILKKAAAYFARTSE